MLERLLLPSLVTDSLHFRFIEILSLKHAQVLALFHRKWCCKIAISIWVWLQSEEDVVLAKHWHSRCHLLLSKEKLLRHSWCHLLLSKEKLLSRWSLQDRIMKIALIYTSCRIDERKSNSNINDIVKELRVWIALHWVLCSSLCRSFAQLRVSRWFYVITICVSIAMCQKSWVTFSSKIWSIRSLCVFIALTHLIFLKMRCVDVWMIITMLFARSFDASMILNQVDVSSVFIFSDSTSSAYVASSAHVTRDQNLDASIMSENDWNLIHEFYSALENFKRDICNICNEINFDKKLIDWKKRCSCH